MPYGNRRFLSSSPENEAMVLCRKIGLFTMGSSMRGFNQSRSQPWAPLACFATEPFASAFSIARAHACPRGKVPSTGKTLHIGSNFCQDHFRQTPFDAGNSHQALELGFLWAEPLGNFCTQTLDFLIQGINVGKLFADQDPVVRLELPLQCLNKQIMLGSHLPTGELCQHGWIFFNSD